MSLVVRICIKLLLLEHIVPLNVHVLYIKIDFEVTDVSFCGEKKQQTGYC